MIYRLELQATPVEVTWEWCWRKSFKRFSRWHYSLDSFDFRSAIVDRKTFDWDSFSFCSNVDIPECYKYRIYVEAKAKVGSNKYLEIPDMAIVHVTSDKTTFIDFNV